MQNCTNYASVKFDEKGEISSARNDILLNNFHKTYAHTDCLSTHTATHSRHQYPSTILTKHYRTIDYPIQSYPVVSHIHWLPSLNTPAKKSPAQCIVNLKNKMNPKTNCLTHNLQRTPEY